MSARSLLLISSISYLLAIGFDARTNVIGSAFALLGLITLVLGVISFIKEKKRKRKHNIHNEYLFTK